MALTPCDGSTDTTIFYWLSAHYGFQQTPAASLGRRDNGEIAG
jgi:hypothetical protein